MKRMFTMNGQTFTSMAEIARELGVSRVRPNDFNKYGIEEVTEEPTSASSNLVDFPVQVADDTTDSDLNTDETPDSDEQVVSQDEVTTEEDAFQDSSDEGTAEDSQEPEDEPSEKSQEPKVDKRFTRKLGTPEQVQQVQDNVSSMTITEFSSFVSHFSVEALETLAVAAGVNTWDNITNAPIRKMRLLMELKAHYFPNEKTPVKHASGWKKLTLDELLKIAKDNKVDYKTSDDPKIQRMWITLALNSSGLNPEDYVPKKQKKDDQGDVKDA